MPTHSGPRFPSQRDPRSGLCRLLTRARILSGAPLTYIAAVMFRPRRLGRRGAKVALFGIALAACSAAATPDPNVITGQFDVGGRSLFVECHGSGSLTIVMDAGFGAIS